MSFLDLLEIDGFYWFRWVFVRLPGPSIFSQNATFEQDPQTQTG